MLDPTSQSSLLLIAMHLFLFTLHMADEYIRTRGRGRTDGPASQRWCCSKRHGRQGVSGGLGQGGWCRMPWQPQSKESDSLDGLLCAELSSQGQSEQHAGAWALASAHDTFISW